MPPDPRTRRRASFGRRSTPPARASRREYKARGRESEPGERHPEQDRQERRGPGRDELGYHAGEHQERLRVRHVAQDPLTEGPRACGPGRGSPPHPGGRGWQQLVFRREQQARTEVDKVRGAREPQRQEGRRGGDDHCRHAGCRRGRPHQVGGKHARGDAETAATPIVTAFCITRMTAGPRINTSTATRATKAK
jgi:hypothetical protein